MTLEDMKAALSQERVQEYYDRKGLDVVFVTDQDSKLVRYQAVLTWSDNTSEDDALTALCMAGIPKEATRVYIVLPTLHGQRFIREWGRELPVWYSLLGWE